MVVAAALLAMVLVSEVAVAQNAPAPPATGAEVEAGGAPEAAVSKPPMLFYANPLWLALVIVSVVFWLYVTAWVADDARGAGLDFPMAAALHMAGGGVGILLTLLVHAAFAFLMIALVLTCFTVYIVGRNKVVPEQFKFLGAAHRQQLLARTPVLGKLAGIKPRLQVARVAIPVRNASGHSLEELRIEEPSLAEPVGILADVIARAASTATRKVRLQPVGEQYIAQFILDGVLHNVEALDAELGQDVLACASQFMGLSKGGKMRKGSAKLHVELPGQGEVEIDATITSSGGKPVLVLDMPSWTADLFKAGLEALGVHEVLVKRFKAAVDQKRGALVVCGPPGSGKTTTLYNVVRTLDVFTTDIFALEKQEEYELEHVRRFAFGGGNPFAKVYVEMMREGPEVIVFGEIEAAEHAEKLLSFAADEGLLLAELESTDAPQGLLRLAEVAGAELVNRSVSCVVAQQLLRKLCTNCREEVEPNPAVLKKLNINPATPAVWYRPVGCDMCLNSGYRGRTGIFALLIVTDPIKEILTKPDASVGAIRQVAGKAAFRTMYQDGVAKVLAGITTLEEVRRVLRRP